MASVRMTNDLRHEIRNAARRAYHVAHPAPTLSSACRDFMKPALEKSLKQTTLRRWRKECHDLGIVGMAGDVSMVPTSPKDPISAICLKGIGADPKNLLNDVLLSAVITFDTPIQWLLLSGSRHHWGDPEVFIKELQTDDQPAALEFLQEHCTAVDTHGHAQRHYEGSIYDLLQNCTTLKQLLEIWPAAESLVPNNKLHQMHEKITRVQRATEIKEAICFDPTLANQTVLTAKLLGV